MIGTALALVLSACSGTGDAGPTASSTPQASDGAADLSPFIHRPIDREAPAFTLLDTDSRPVSLVDYEGKWLLVDWVFTNCVDFCPLLTGDMSNAYRLLGDAVGDRVEFVTISFDPTRDSPQQMKAYAAQVGGLKDGWTWLTGSQSETDAIASAYGVSFTPAEAVDGVDQFDHTSLMVVIGPDGRERHRYLGTGWSEDVVERLEDDFAAETLAAGATEATTTTSTTSAPGSNAVDDDLDVLAEAIVLPWEEFELRPGVTSQVLYQFPNPGYRETFVQSLLEPARERGDDPDRIILAVIDVYKVPTADGGHFGVADIENLAVVVEGNDWTSIFRAFAALDNEWCCGGP